MRGVQPEGFVPTSFTQQANGTTDQVPVDLKGITGSEPVIQREGGATALATTFATTSTISVNHGSKTRTASIRQTITSQTEEPKKERPSPPSSKPRLTSYDQVLNCAQRLYNNDEENNLDTFLSNFLKDPDNRLQKIDKKTLGEWEQNLRNDMMKTVIENPNSFTEKIISKIRQNLANDKTKYSIDNLITFAQENKASWDYIIAHLFLKRDEPYSATDIVKILNQGNIRIEFLKNNGVDLLGKLIDLNLHSGQEQKSLLSNFAENIRSAQNSDPESFDINIIDTNIKKKKHNFFTKLFRRLFRRH